MQHKKFIQIAKTLSNAEMKRFALFVDAAYVNTNQNLVKLWQFIQKYAPKFDHPKMTEPYAFQYLFPNEQYREEVITKLLNKLFDLFKTFIAYNGLDEAQTINAQINAKLKENLLLIDFYTKRLPIYANPTLEKTEQLCQQITLRDPDYYLNNFKIATLRAAHLSNTQDKQDIGLNDALHKSNLYYSINQLYLTCLAVNQTGIANITAQTNNIDNILQHIDKHPQHLNIEHIALWYECLKLLTQNDKKTHYYNVKNCLNNIKNQLNTHDIRIIYTFLENNAKKISDTDQQFYQELFELYDTQLQQNIIQTFTPNLFKNMVVVALRLEQYQWIKDLLDNRQNDIILQYRDAVHQYIDVHLLFKQRQFGDALMALSRADYGIDLFFKLDARRMYLKIFYELDYQSAFYDLINSFRKFLSDQKNQIANYHIQANRNFISIITRLYQQQNNYKADKQKLQQEINNLTAQQLPEKNWLLNKLNNKIYPL